jgi:hypothetical protein
MLALRIIITLLIAVGCLSAADRFDIAAIHPDDPNSTGASMKFLPGGGLSISGMNIRNLIWLAWQLPPERVIGGPKWIDSDKYSIEAKTAAPSASSMAAEQVRIQTLLYERFHLKEHRESKVSPGYELSVAPGGVRLRKDTDASGKGSILPWSMIVGELSRRLGRPVVDRTSLTGAWFIDLHQLADGGDDAGASIFSAVRGFGLKLDATKTAVQLLVIDSIERPTPN